MDAIHDNARLGREPDRAGLALSPVYTQTQQPAPPSRKTRHQGTFAPRILTSNLEKPMNPAQEAP